ncbi:MAG: hypothetical protein KGP28_04955 [Bdellovibrionales bacterium]|nr:hypothetical protein [Bdellovibrionales bacterium]
MVADSDSENWIPLVEFSVKKGISLSTLRRYIKSNKIPWKLLEGRYLVLDDGTFTAPRNHDPRLNPPHSSEDMDARVKNIEQALNAANEEIAELKTLVAFYEEKWAQLSKK